MVVWITTLIGVSLLMWTVADIFSTVLVIGDGAGRQSGRLADLMWKSALRFHDPQSRRSHRRLRCVGPLIVLVILVIWVGQIILSWALVFGPTAFVNRDVSFGDRFVFAGRTVAGRGGNTPRLEASSGLWEVVHGMAGLSGVTIISIGLAYVLPVLRGVAEKRAVAVRINALGNSVSAMQEMVERAPDGGDIDLHLLAITTAVAQTAEVQRAYPVLHYFHSSDVHAALAPAIARVSLLVGTGLPPAPKVDATVIEPLAAVVGGLLDGIAEMGLDEQDKQARASSERRSDDGARTPSLAEHSRLRAYVEFDGWSWDVVEG
jgi:hypothetical protein